MEHLHARGALHQQYQMNDVKALLFGMNSISRFLQMAGEKQNYFILGQQYEHFYYLTTIITGSAFKDFLYQPSMTAEPERMQRRGWALKTTAY